MLVNKILISRNQNVSKAYRNFCRDVNIQHFQVAEMKFIASILSRNRFHLGRILSN